MEHIRDYVETLKRKPQHIRQRVALGTSLGITAIVAVGWMTALANSGTLAFSTPPETPESANVSTSVKESANQFGSLLGAANAYSSQPGEGQVTVVDGASSSTLDKSAADDTRTVIPF